jgi:hypothetical protein
MGWLYVEGFHGLVECFHGLIGPAESALTECSSSVGRSRTHSSGRERSPREVVLRLVAQDLEGRFARRRELRLALTYPHITGFPSLPEHSVNSMRFVFRLRAARAPVGFCFPFSDPPRTINALAEVCSSVGRNRSEVEITALYRVEAPAHKASFRFKTDTCAKELLESRAPGTPNLRTCQATRQLERDLLAEIEGNP